MPIKSQPFLTEIDKFFDDVENRVFQLRQYSNPADASRVLHLRGCSQGSV